MSSPNSLQVLLADERPDQAAVRLTLRSLALAGVEQVMLAEPVSAPGALGNEVAVHAVAPGQLVEHIQQTERVLLLRAGCIVPRTLLTQLHSLPELLQPCHPLLSNDADPQLVPPSGGDCDSVQDGLSAWSGRYPIRTDQQHHAMYCASDWLADQLAGGREGRWLDKLTCSNDSLPIYIYRAVPSLAWPQRSFVSAFSRGPTRWYPKPALWEMGRAYRRYRQAPAQPGTGHDGPKPENRWRQLRASRRELSPAPPAPGALRVTYVLQDLLIAGGVLSVIQLVNELNLSGVDARIAATFEDPKVYRWLPFVRRPMIYGSAEDLVENLPECDLLVATLWTTAPLVKQLLDQGRTKKAAYFVQGFEANFYPDSPSTQAQVESTYNLLDTRIVKSDWLAAKLAELGCATHKIALGMDLDLFRPGLFPPEQPLVLALARPAIGVSEYDAVIRALASVKAAHPDVSIALFGDDNLQREAIPFPYIDLGVVFDRATLVRWYHKASVVVDLCSSHGFGRCGLEAMACGTPCVLAKTGGVLEYAIHEHNALLVDSADDNQAGAAIVRLLDPGPLPQQLRAAGLETAKYYDKTAEGKRTKAFFKELMN